MDQNFLELIEPTPKIESKKCKFIALLLSLSLTYSPLLVGIVIWYFYDYFFAGATLLITYLVIGIIRSQLRNDVIPINQREFHYTDKAIAAWVVAKQLCHERKNED
jgi:hypothetical protein